MRSSPTRCRPPVASSTRSASAGRGSKPRRSPSGPAGSAPGPCHRIGLALVVRTTPDEAGAHTLSISLVDPKGEARSFGDKPSFEATFASPDGEGTATLALNLDGLVFEIEGAHTIVLGIDGAEAARLPFRVQTLPGQPPSDSRRGVSLYRRGKPFAPRSAGKRSAR